LTYLHAAGVSKAFVTGSGEHLLALDEVDLAVEQGEFCALLGPSGCGKSTLLKIVAGLAKATSGSCAVDGTPVVQPRREVSLVFQEPTLLPWRDLRDNVGLGLEVRGVGKQERRETAERYLSLVGLQGFERSYPDELSGGMQQRGAIARALSTDPKALLMDEPFGALDEQTRLVMGEELLAICDRLRITILFVTHSIQEAILLADKIVVMSRRPGRVMSVIPVDLPRPRRVEALTTTEGQRLQAQIWSLLRPEALAAMRGEAGVVKPA
jgi:NitT/TauT family transport system ATP-binding protein